jgi:hypothetical protein
MLTLWGPDHTTCDGANRRDFLKIGALAAGGLTLADLLRLQAEGASSRQTPAKAKSAILVFLAGGPSHFETYDPKPLAPAEVRGPFGTIPTNVPGIELCEKLPRHAKIADKYSIIRSCHHGNAGHGGGARHVLTGYPSASPEDELPHDYPHVGSLVARTKGANRTGMPAFVAIPPSRRNHAMYLGAAYEPFELYSNGRFTGVDLGNNVKSARLEDRRSLREAFDKLRREVDSSGMMSAMDALEQQAYEMVTTNAARDALDVSKESSETRALYGDHDWGKSCLLARRLVEAGVGFVSVSMGGWDHHGNAGGSIETGIEKNNPPMDQGVCALIEDLHRRGLQQDVLVWVWGEFGRTPRVNREGGRDHWPQAMSVLLSGGGLKMGQVIGATTSRGERPLDRAVTPEDVLATVYRQLGIDSERQFLNSAGRPISILPHGTPIAELV